MDVSLLLQASTHLDGDFNGVQSPRQPLRLPGDGVEGTLALLQERGEGPSIYMCPNGCNRRGREGEDTAKR